MASISASQLLGFSIYFSVVITILILTGGKGILSALFGKVDDEVMKACITYLSISALSYPMLGIYNAGAAVYRSLGRTGTTMVISGIANIINIAGNFIGVFVLHAGVAGVAWPSFVARTFSAAVITALCFRKEKTVRYMGGRIFRIDWDLLKRILGIAIPNGIEQGIFQFVKVALSSVVSLFGTYQIAAHGVSQSIWALAALSGLAMSPVFITVIGQCMGSGDVELAERCFKRLMKITFVISIVWNGVIILLTPLFMVAYNLEPETQHLVFKLVILHNVFNAFVYPFFGALGSGLRATGDVKYVMFASLGTTLGVRLVLAWILAIHLNLGVMGVAWAMCFDWCGKAILNYSRFRSGKWKTKKVI